MPASKLPPDPLDREKFLASIRDLYASGHSILGLARAFNVGYATMHKYLELSGVNLRQRGRPLHLTVEDRDAFYEELLAEYEIQHKSMSQIARERKTQPQSIQRYIQRARVSRRARQLQERNDV